MRATRHPQRPAAILDPLAPGPWGTRLGTLGLPAVMLSWASVLAFLIVLMAVQHSPPLRAHYALAVGWPWLVALGTAGLAGSIVIAGRRRPGPLWPRIWALALAGLAALIALGALAPAAWLPQPQWHALITATLAGTLTLAPRLVRIHPDSDWTQRIAPASLLLTLALILPLARSDAPGPGAGTDPPAAGRDAGAAPGPDAANRAISDTPQVSRRAPVAGHAPRR